ncbi:MAG: CHRD domain-containing protein [Acidobacteria bacterium]|nr:CHRD domain-containing protein [Acidobacteriota bacterium]
MSVTDLTIVQRILDTPSAFYLNVHSTLNPGGVVRAQLVRTQ